mmetsp:Transcript_49720/g.127891  ORF Transcript_49720/g.127891 Transcript_49720/m.127891 type:complete len:102 (-) Transcript_49720:80-385(-)
MRGWEDGRKRALSVRSFCTALHSDKLSEKRRNVNAGRVWMHLKCKASTSLYTWYTEILFFFLSAFSTSLYAGQFIRFRREDCSCVTRREGSPLLQREMPGN